MLPKTIHPNFDLVIPSTKKKIKVRPMLAREEKILLMAKQSGEYKDFLSAVQQVVSNCIVTDSVKLEDLAVFDLEFLFIRIRALSISNIVKPRYRDSEDEKDYDLEIDLNKIEVQFPKDTSNKIDCGSNITLIMKYPSCSLLTDEEYLAIDDTEMAFDALLKGCIDSIHTPDKSYDVKTTTSKELTEFIDGLPIPAYQMMKKFLLELPKIEHTLKWTNSKGTERVVVLESLNDFFLLV